MRVASSQRRRDEGATLVIAAAFFLVAAIFIAFVVDIGNQRQNRRQLTTATDSAALAVARDWSSAGLDPTFDCDDTLIDETLSAANNPVDNPTPTYSCSFTDVVPFRSGVVTISSTERVEYALGGVTGVDESSTGSLTSVRVQPVIGGGLRPVAVCSEDFDTTGWTNPSPGVLVNPNPATTVITMTNVSGNAAGSGPCDVVGNWNQVLFREDNICPGQENAGGGANEFGDQYENGSPFDVAVNECVSRVPGTGGFNSADAEAIEGTVVAFPVFDSAEGGGAGIYLVKGFLEVYVVDVVTGPPGNTTTFLLQPRRYLSQGTCCLLNDFNAEQTVCDTGTLNGDANADSTVNCAARDLSGNPPEPPIPPEPACEVTVSPPSQPVPRVGGRTATAVTFTVLLSDELDCTGLDFSLVRTAGGQEVAFSSTTAVGTSVTLTLDAGTNINGTYLVTVEQGGEVLDNTATLTTT